MQKEKIKQVLPIRKLASLIRKITVTANLIFPAYLHSRTLLWDKNNGLKNYGWNGTVMFSHESLEQLDW